MRRLLDVLPDVPRLSLGAFPTPVSPLPELARGPGQAVYVKHDDRSGVLYGGNKVRKLEAVLYEARRRGKTRLLTVGAAGSHHVLATATYGRAHGFRVAAVLVPQPGNAHVMANLRAGLGQGLEPICARGYAEVPLQILANMTPDTAFISLGGSSVVGTLGYVLAAFELAAQVEAGVLPEPDVLVVALGSGGTAAGLAVGLEAAGLRTQVHAVAVSSPVVVLAAMLRGLVRRTARRLDLAPEGALARIHVDGAQLGDGYGFATEPGDRATTRAHALGLTLDPTYTAKAFAALLQLLEEKTPAAPQTVLFWHTLSSVPLTSLLAGAPALEGEVLELCRR